jgi:hypothetical protein
VLWLLVAGCHFGLRQECESDGDCPRGSVCRVNVDVTVCAPLPVPPAVNPVGEICRKDDQCESLHCNGGFCDDTTCTRDEDCPGGWGCAPVVPGRSSPRRCARPTGDPCVRDAICLSGGCLEGTCACGQGGAPCATKDDCCRGTCSDHQCLVNAPTDAGSPGDAAAD